MFKKCSRLQWAAVLTAILFVICSAAAWIGVCTSRGLVLHDCLSLTEDPAALTVDHPEVADFTVMGDSLRIVPHSAGQIEIRSGEMTLVMADCRENGFVTDHLSGHYTGYEWVQWAVLAFLLGTSIILGIALRRQMKEAFYHYATPLLVGLLLLNLLILLMLTVLLLPGNSTLENTLAGLPSALMIVTLPLMTLFALCMLVSNISLLRHEGKTWRNLLGSIIGFALSLAAYVILINSDSSGSLEEAHFHDLLVNFFSGVVLWTECKLVGIILCGIRAAKSQPAMDKDYILILGCKLSRKGGLTPLLRGRVDRALGFARQQEQATGHMPVLIPCGGKGRDELRSEASAMHEYLLEQGVPEERILCEDRSENTWENIRNAKAMMKPDARTAYATTNYHVFRAGVWASRNGLQAEGMGSRTKWYYWPNAFMREYVALITANMIHEIFMLVMIGIQSGLLAYLYH